MIDRLKRIRGIPFLLRKVTPAYSYCEICGLPWNHAKTHDIQLNKYEGFFAVCEHCHRHASEKELLEAYITTWRKYWRGTKHSWSDYARAIKKDVASRENKDKDKSV